jgi:hypothetical protein
MRGWQPWNIWIIYPLPQAFYLWIRERRALMKSATKASSWIPKQFVQHELSEAESKKLKATQPTLDEYDDRILKLNEAGYKITLSVDNYNQCHQAMMQQGDQNGDNSQLILVARGSTPLKALKKLIYIHYSFQDQIWPHPDRSRERIEFDD